VYHSRTVFPNAKYVPKEWGAEIWLVNNELYCAKYLLLEPGWQCSLHCHAEKDETFFVLEGRCNLEFGMERRVLQKGDLQRIAPGMYHRFSCNRYDPLCTILEVSTHHSDEDVLRKEPSGRVAENLETTTTPPETPRR
jgi:uncharacterized cupin superfamily protein